MAQRLSKRMQAVADLVSPCEKMADIGTDHGYVPIYLVEQGIVKRAIAMDINEGPLLRAKEHIQSAGLTDYIETRRSNGLEKLLPGEADAVTIAGMGGGLIIRILTEGEKVAEQLSQIIVQPQSEIASVRRFLQESGWLIAQEEMLCEEGKYYMVMKCVHGTMPPLSAAECEYGPFLLKEKHPVLEQYLEERLEKQRSLLESLMKQPETEAIAQRRRELMEELAVTEEAYKEISL